MQKACFSFAEEQAFFSNNRRRWQRPYQFLDTYHVYYKAGYEIIAGAKHDKAIHKETGKMIAIPRHKGDIPVGTAHNIL